MYVMTKNSPYWESQNLMYVGCVCVWTQHYFACLHAAFDDAQIWIIYQLNQMLIKE